MQSSGRTRACGMLIPPRLWPGGVWAVAPGGVGMLSCWAGGPDGPTRRAPRVAIPGIPKIPELPLGILPGTSACGVDQEFRGGGGPVSSWGPVFWETIDHRVLARHPDRLAMSGLAIWVCESTWRSYTSTCGWVAGRQIFLRSCVPNIYRSDSRIP